MEGGVIIMEKPKNKRKKIIISTIISFSSLLIIYLGMSIYFMNHFYFRATINCINVSGKTVDNVNEQMTDKIQTYTLELEGRGGIKEKISAADIGLKYNSHNKIQDLKDDQNSFQWLRGVFNEKQYELSDIALYDEKLLKECINELSYFNSNNIIKPKNASFKYTNKSYEIINEINGNEINKDVLYNNIVNAILKEQTTINLNAINCYKAPKYTSKSKEILDVKNILNKYTSSTITYDSGKSPKILDGSTINTWLKVDENLEITFDKEKVRDYVNILAGAYDTLGKTRNFVTASGRTVKVSGGDYGWLVNRSKEVQALIETIKEGKTIRKEPIYAQTALFYGINDIGNTYVEIDLTKQYLWFYKNNSIIVEGNVVTGNVSSNHSTPQGTYNINYKQKDAVLRGPGYSAPVTFWMPFNGGIGIHDATWRTDFGGKIYKTAGSHGCINAPYNVAQAIFNNIETGTPVICHF
jgi:lipoprotein-anchoring transpeptidase ErfK/SrfK